MLYGELADEGQGGGKQGMEDWCEGGLHVRCGRQGLGGGRQYLQRAGPGNNSFRFFIPMENPNNIYYSKLNHEVVMGGNDGFISVRADLSMPKDDKAQLFLRVSW